MSAQPPLAPHIPQHPAPAMGQNNVAGGAADGAAAVQAADPDDLPTTSISMLAPSPCGTSIFNH